MSQSPAFVSVDRIEPAKYRLKVNGAHKGPDITGGEALAETVADWLQAAIDSKEIEVRNV